MVALGSKCLVGDQLHPNGAINPDTYASVAPAYARVAKLEPFLEGARQVSEVAILSSEFFHPQGDRNAACDDGAAQMLLEMKLPFDVLDGFSDFSPYKVIILPDEIPVEGDIADKLNAYVAAGGSLLLSGQSGQGADGRFTVPAGIEDHGPVAYKPSYVKASEGVMSHLTRTPFVVYGTGRQITTSGAEVLAEIVPPYFNRAYNHFCSHQHAPDNPEAAALGPAVTLNGRVGYIAFPIFSIYHDVGQPLYRHLVEALLRRLLPDPVLATDLPSAGRATVARQEDRSRHIVHLLYGPPQVRGKAIPQGEGTRVMEMIEDIPAIGPVTASVRLPTPPRRAYEAISGQELEITETEAGRYAVTLDRLHIHAAVVFEHA